MNTLPEIINDPHIQARGMIAELPVAKSQKTIKVSGSPVHLSRTPINLKRGAAAIGEHTREALELIGRSLKEIERLAEAGVVSLDEGDSQ
jgi:CoA:oxalate CoA-transferase